MSECDAMWCDAIWSGASQCMCMCAGWSRVGFHFIFLIDLAGKSEYRVECLASFFYFYGLVVW